MSGTVNRYATYSSELSNRLFPGNDYYSEIAKSYFNEAWMTYNKDLNDIQDFIGFLTDFTPASVKDQLQNPVWEDSTRRNWDSCRSQIIQKLNEIIKSG